MEVYLIPVGDPRYELYCEVDEGDDEDADRARQESARAGFFRRKFLLFRERLRQAERDLHYGSSSSAAGLSWTHRLTDRAICWIAERIAEQRLLWHLRGRVEAAFIYPSDLTEHDAVSLLKGALKTDLDRHLRWLIFDGVMFLVTGVLLGPLFLLVPGVANLPAAYFGFMMVGHFLSMRGARQGLMRVTWRATPSEPLRELRRAITLDPLLRERRVLDIASQLQLERLPMFFERTLVARA
jgi:hypothetical protein